MINIKTNLVKALDTAVEEYKKVRANRDRFVALILDTESGDLTIRTLNEPGFTWNTEYNSDPSVNLNCLMEDDVFEGMWHSSEITLNNLVYYIEWKFPLLAYPQYADLLKERNGKNSKS